MSEKEEDSIQEILRKQQEEEEKFLSQQQEEEEKLLDQENEDGAVDDHVNRPKKFSWRRVALLFVIIFGAGSMYKMIVPPERTYVDPNPSKLYEFPVTSQSDETEFERTKRATEQGHAEAQHNLGEAYTIGKGVPEDFNQAIMWFSLAAEQGHAEAQHNLGLMYYTGVAAPQDYKEAVKWWTKSAEQGHAEAQHNLGLLYANGEGVPKDYNQASQVVYKVCRAGACRGSD